MEYEADVVKVGVWYYGGSVEKSVRIIRQNVDEYHEPGYTDEPPTLNAEGYAYYVVYGAPRPPEPGRGWQTPSYPSRSRTCLSLEEAEALARETIDGDIDWGRLPEWESDS